MSTMYVFWALVHNDTRWGTTFRSKDNAKWNLFYLATAGLLLGFGLYTSNLFAEKIIVVLNFIATPNEVLILLLVYSSSYFTYRLLPREWMNGTEGWWLSLPYSRKLLLAAKCMSGFLGFIKFIFIVVIATLFLTILTITLHPATENSALLHDITQRILYSSAIAILISPFFLIWGITLAAWDHLELLRAFLPASILGMIGNISIIIFTLNRVLSPDSFHSSTWLSLLLVFGFSTGLSALLFFYVAYILEHKVGYYSDIGENHTAVEFRMTKTKIFIWFVVVIVGLILVVNGYSGS